MTSLRKVMVLVALLNVAYFGVEFAGARAIGSVSLFAGSIGFLEDPSLDILIAIALGWAAGKRGRLGMALVGILLIPAIAAPLNGTAPAHWVLTHVIF